jgi:hypothetical protein
MHGPGSHSLSEYSCYDISLILVQIWNLYIALIVFACFFTFTALRRSVAYGHLQTLANLADEWSLVRWWRYKGDGIWYCFASHK